MAATPAQIETAKDVVSSIGGVDVERVEQVGDSLHVHYRRRADYLDHPDICHPNTPETGFVEVKIAGIEPFEPEGD